MANTDKFFLTIDTLMASPTRGGHHVSIAIGCHACNRLISRWTDLPIPFTDLVNDMARHDETHCKGAQSGMSDLFEKAAAASAWIIPGCTIVYSDGAGDHVCGRTAIAFGITISNNKLRIEFFCEDHWR